MNFCLEKIAPMCAEFGVILDEKKTEQLNAYGTLLLEWNEKINLTAIKDPEGILYKHFYDCLLFFKQVSLPTGASLVDVGTVAGFPGMVLKIVRPDLKVTLLDSLNKRLIFLNEVISALGLAGIETLHLRAEEAGKGRQTREQFDFAAARAVASLPVLLEYCIPLVKPGGFFVAMKGPSAGEETALCKNAESLLHCKQTGFQTETLPNGDPRVFCIFKKISQTPPKYPRKPAEIAKQPL